MCRHAKGATVRSTVNFYRRGGSHLRPGLAIARPPPQFAKTSLALIIYTWRGGGHLWMGLATA